MRGPLFATRRLLDHCPLREDRRNPVSLRLTIFLASRSSYRFLAHADNSSNETCCENYVENALLSLLHAAITCYPLLKLG
jgi:hypothetical protein